MASTNPTEQQFAEYVHQGQNVVLDLTRSATETWARALRTVGGVGADGASLPTPAQVVDRTYEAAHQALENQRQFAHSVLSALEPAVRATEQVADSWTQKARASSN